MDQGLGNNSYGKGFDKTMIDDKDKENALPEIIAIDFDGTLVSNKYPEIGEINTRVWNAALGAQFRGVKLILWTSRTGQHLTNAVRFCEENGLVFDAINDNIAEVKALGWNARKVFASIYIDDRAGFINLAGKFDKLRKEFLFD